MSELQKTIDQSVGRWGIKLFRKHSNNPVLKENSKILIIKNKAIGDSVYILPLLRELYSEFGAKIDVLCDNSNKLVFSNQRFVNKILDFKISNILLNWKEYDLVIDAEPWSNISAIIARIMGKTCIGFSHAERSKLYDKTILYNKKQHIVQTYLDFFRLFSEKKPSDKLVKLVISKKAKVSAKKYVKKKSIGIAAGVSGNAKGRMWSLKRWNSLIKKINEKYPQYDIILLGVKKDFDIAEEINQGVKAKNLHGKTSLEELFEIISKCKLFIGCDSGPIHISATQGVKTIGLFGPNTPVIWAPYGRKNISLFHKNPGVPTVDNTHPYFVKPTAAEKKSMEDITVEEVFSSFKKLIK